MLRVGIIGCGYWGPKLVRVFFENNRVALMKCCDLEQSRLDKVTRSYPNVGTTRDYRDIVCAPDIDAVVVATPVSTHYQIAKEALENGKHVLIEKPIAHSYKVAQELMAIATRRKQVVMVDHVFVYTQAVMKIRELIDSGEVGEIYYMDFTRINLGLFQQDVSVVWDLACHDISIANYLLRMCPDQVSSVSISHFGGELPNIAYISLLYGDNTIVHINVNWLAPVKVRMGLIGGSKKMIVYDDTEPSEKVKVYDKGVDVSMDLESRSKILVDYRLGDVHVPKIDQVEGLQVMAGHFIDCIETGQEPVSSGKEGMDIVRILEACEESAEKGGQFITL